MARATCVVRAMARATCVVRPIARATCVVRPIARATCVVRALVLTGLFASCVATPEARWRNPEGAIASTTRFDADRFEGEWRRVAAFSASFLAPACPSIRFVREGAGLRVALCGTGRGEFYAVDPLGRLTQGSGPPLWVLWVDEGFRTAVIGTPDGSFGWILERTGSVEQDRLAAAREILAFNGYDPARMTLLR